MPKFSRSWWSLIALAIAGAMMLPATVSAQGNVGGLAPSSTIPAAQTYACGAGQTFFGFGISTHANLMQLASPAGVEHLFVSGLSNGWQVCYSTGGPFVTAADFGFSDTGGGGST